MSRCVFFTLTLGVALGIAWFLPLTAVELCARILMPAIALMGAGIFPSMGIVVGAMRAEERTPAAVGVLYEKLRSILSVFACAFIYVVLLVFLVLASVVLASSGDDHEVPQRVAVFFTVFFMILFCERSYLAARVFFAVLALNKNQALLVAEENNRKLFVQARKDARIPSDNYGSKERQQLKKVE